jgi:hypothetical protein
MKNEDEKYFTSSSKSFNNSYHQFSIAALMAKSGAQQQQQQQQQKKRKLQTEDAIGGQYNDFFLFVCIAAKRQVMGPGLTNERTLTAVPSRILIYSARCDTTPVANSLAAISVFPWRGISLQAVTHPSTDCPDVASLLCSNRGNRCFNIIRPLALEFGLLCMVRQPSADTHVI